VVTNSAGSVTSAPAALATPRPTVNTSAPPRRSLQRRRGRHRHTLKPSYNLGETVTLTTTPFTGSVFVDWRGPLGPQPRCAMDADRV
jgi:hypothetical protein